MNINWTRRALANYDKIIQYLSLHWTKKELDNFIKELELVIEQIEQNPYMFQTSNKNIRKPILIA